MRQNLVYEHICCSIMTSFCLLSLYAISLDRCTIAENLKFFDTHHRYDAYFTIQLPSINHRIVKGLKKLTLPKKTRLLCCVVPLSKKTKTQKPNSTATNFFSIPQGWMSTAYLFGSSLSLVALCMLTRINSLRDQSYRQWKEETAILKDTGIATSNHYRMNYKSLLAVSFPAQISINITSFLIIVQLASDSAMTFHLPWEMQLVSVTGTSLFFWICRIKAIKSSLYG